jgi:CheY-like chemotaxis protein
MPCKRGLECLKEIREQLPLHNLPNVIYSSSTYMTDIQRSYIHKADLYMVKPFNSFYLKNALESVLTTDCRKKFSEQKHYFINNRFVPFTA